MLSRETTSVISFCDILYMMSSYMVLRRFNEIWAWVGWFYDVNIYFQGTNTFEIDGFLIDKSALFLDLKKINYLGTSAAIWENTIL